MILRLVYRHVKDAEMQLAQIEQSAVEIFRLDQFLDEVVGYAFSGFGAVGLGFLLPRFEVLAGKGGVVSAKCFQL